MSIPNDQAQPRVTVIIACKQAVGFLPQCLGSLAAQTVQPHQVILKDALSHDGTEQLPKKYPALPLQVVSIADTGISDAWNQALEFATGDWVLFLGADDALHAPGVLEQACEGLKRVPSEVDIAYGQVLMVDQHGIPIERLGDAWEKTGPAMRHWAGLFLPHQGAFHRRTAFDRFGKFDTSFRLAGDYEFFRRMLPQSPAVYLPSLIVTDMRDGGLSGQPRHAMRGALEVRRAIRLHGRLMWQTQLITLRCTATYVVGFLLGDQRTISLRQWARRKAQNNPRKEAR